MNRLFKRFYTFDLILPRFQRAIRRSEIGSMMILMIMIAADDTRARHDSREKILARRAKAEIKERQYLCQIQNSSDFD
jgi:hypothetical protein